MSDLVLTFETERLLLRPFAVSDDGDVERLAGEREIAATTELVPHPYPPGAAREWILGHDALRAGGTQYPFAVILRPDGPLVGAAGLKVLPEQAMGSLGYWVGKPWWGRGIAREAAAALLAFGFDQLGLHKITARVFSRNQASVRVLESIGLAREGHRPQHFLKWGVYEDIDEYGLLASDWHARPGSPEAADRRPQSRA